MSEAIDSFLLELTSDATAAATTLPPPRLEDDFHESVCGVCETGGSLVCCRDACLRSFHPSCIDLRVSTYTTPITRHACGNGVCMQEEELWASGFRCSDCENKVHRCFSCKEFQTEAQLLKCSVEFCGKYYHPQCMGAGGEGGQVCPIHTCGTCNETLLDPSKRRNTLRCFRCPKSFHMKCRPRDLHSLGQGLFLCIAHVSEQENLPALSAHLLRPAAAPATTAMPQEDSDLYFHPGLIVRLDGIRPGTHVFAIKDAIREIADVRFLEFDENGSDWALARYDLQCHTPKHSASHAAARMGDARSAQALVTAASDPKGLCIPFLRSGARASGDCSPSYPSARSLTGEEELDYWRKTIADGKGRRKRPDSLASDRPTRRMRPAESEDGNVYSAHSPVWPQYHLNANSCAEADRSAPYLSRTASVLQNRLDGYPSRAVGAPYYAGSLSHMTGPSHGGFDVGFHSGNRSLYSGSGGGYYNQTGYVDSSDRGLSLSAFPRLAALSGGGVPPYPEQYTSAAANHYFDAGGYVVPSPYSDGAAMMAPHHYSSGGNGSSASGGYPSPSPYTSGYAYGNDAAMLSTSIPTLDMHQPYGIASLAFGLLIRYP